MKRIDVFYSDPRVYLYPIETMSDIEICTGGLEESSTFLLLPLFPIIIAILVDRSVAVIDLLWARCNGISQENVHSCVYLHIFQHEVDGRANVALCFF